MDKKKYTVLNVDDDDANRYAVTYILRKAGFRVIEAQNGKEVLSKVTENPDIILLDANLPDISGFEICRKLKSDPKTSHIPILLLSATHKKSQSIVKGLEIGADGFLTQPIEPEILKAWIRALLRLKEAELTAREKALEWEETFNSIEFPIFLLDNEGKIINANSSAIELFNINNKNIFKMFINDFLKDKNFPPEAYWKKIDQKDKKQEFFEFEHNEKEYLLTVTKIQSKEGKTKGYIYVLYDKTERKNLERKLYQAQRLESIGRLTAGIAHDFNNMLTVVIGYTDMLLLSMSENDKNRNIIEEINKAGKRASNLVQNLLTFSRKQIMEPSVENINNIIMDMTKLLDKVIGEDIELIQILDENLEKVYIDRSQFEQVIMNLVINARDAMPEGGKLIIETKNVVLDDNYIEKHRETSIKKGEYVLVAVTDTGIGMDKETVSHIFEPFFTTKAEKGGTGLGLSMVYGIVKRSGGYIWVYSEPGNGTTFKLYIPKTSLKEEVTKIKEEASPIEQQKGTETILVVEDNDQIRELVKISLSKLGYKVITASDSIAAINICRSQKNIDLLITDVVLPEKNGKELYDEIKKLINDIKVLYISGYTETVVSQKGIVKKGIDFLSKPFTPRELTKKVAEVLNK